MANKRISTLPNTDSIPDGSVFPVVMGDGTGTKQVSKETMKKEIGGSAPEDMLATTEKPGTVKPDGVTVEVDEDGTIRVPGAASGNSGIKLANPSNVTISNFDQSARITWTDPENVVYEGARLATWQGTVVVRKEGGTPQNWMDGELVARVTEKNRYQTEALLDENLENGKEYCYGIFPYSDQLVYNYDFTQSFVPEEITLSAPGITSASGKDGRVILDIVNNTEDALVKIVYKAGSAPTSGTDGMIVEGLTSGKVEITGLTNKTEYFFVAYAYSNMKTSSASAPVAATPRQYTLLGFRMKKAESDPATKIEYTEEAVGLTPAKVNLSTGEFDYGSFKNFWFVRDNVPVMLNNDGTEAYELNPNDYTKKADGSPSDVANSSFAGNAMSRIPKVYMKMWEANGYEYCNICDIKLDDSYHAYAHTRADGSEMDYLYLSMFEGSLVSNKVRSIKGLNPMVSKTGTEELTAAKANGSRWSTRSWSQRNLINMLLILMGKTTDTQKAFGYGYYTGGSSSAPNYLTSGGASNKGQFYGTNKTRDYVKVFHIENWWGNVWERIEGCVTNGSTRILVKSVPPYNTAGTGYVDTGVTPGGTSGGYISACKMIEHGLIPMTASGSETTQYPDGLWFAANCYALVGGGCSTGLHVGALALIVNIALSTASWSIGSALSCEQPLAA